LDFPEPDIVIFPPEGDGDVALPTNKERLDGIETRLGQIEVTLGLRPPTPKKGLVAQKYEWAINHKGTSIFLAIILCGVSIFGKYWLDHKNEWWNHDVDDRVSQAINAKGGIKETLARIDTTLATLQPFIQDVIHHQFESASKLPSAALRQRLPALKHLLSIAKDQEVKIDPTIVNRMSKKLAGIPSRLPGFWTPALPLDYWQTVANLVSYRSFNAMSWSPQATFPKCTDSDPETTAINANFTTEGKPSQLTTKLGTYRSCRITLDSPEDATRLNSLLLGGIAGITFYRCLVVYRGGPIKLILAWDHRVVASAEKVGTLTASGNTISFVDCLFDFSIQELPTPQTQQLTEFLLSQNSPTINLPLAATH
jgi:hypothetical protein